MYNDDFLNRCFQDRGLQSRHQQRRSYWDDYADSMELTIEGNRLLAREIARGIGYLWSAVKRRFSEAMQWHDPSGHAPPPV